MPFKHLYEVADSFCQEPENHKNLLFVESMGRLAFYDEEEGYHKFYTVRELDQMARRYIIKHLRKAVTKSSIRDFIFQVEIEVYRSTEKMKTEHVALNDVLLNIGTGETCEYEREKLVFHRLNITSTDMETEAPRFFQFLDEVIVRDDNTPDKELQKVVQEMFGFALLPGLDPHAVFFLVGSGANGKSVLLNLLIEIVGRDFVASSSIQSLTTGKFKFSGLIGKKLNICNEEESKYLRSDTFKALVSGDPIQDERKFGDKYTFYPNTKFLFATNEWPSFDTINEGLRRRFKIIPFKRIIPTELRDAGLFAELKKELPGIIRWAIEGGRRLVENGYQFSKSKAMKEALTTLEEEISSAIKFIRERYEEKEGAFIANSDLYTHYRLWCEENGRKPMNSTNFGKDLTKALLIQSEIRWQADDQRSERGRALILR